MLNLLLADIKIDDVRSHHCEHTKTPCYMKKFILPQCPEYTHIHKNKFYFEVLHAVMARVQFSACWAIPWFIKTNFVLKCYMQWWQEYNMNCEFRFTIKYFIAVLTWGCFGIIFAKIANFCCWSPIMYCLIWKKSSLPGENDTIIFNCVPLLYQCPEYARSRCYSYNYIVKKGISTPPLLAHPLDYWINA